jgi:hypothetical protein
VEGLSAWIGTGVTAEVTVSCFRFWWEVRHEYYLRELQMKARDPRKKKM